MAEKTSPLFSQICRAKVIECIEDGVSRELMTRAVTLVPCGHNFNEYIVIQIIARDNLCPFDRTPIKEYVPNYQSRPKTHISTYYSAIWKNPPYKMIPIFQVS